MPLLFVLALGCFAGALSLRIVDPIVPEIARDYQALAATVAFLASAFAFPYAFSQPILGPLSDAVGKARVIKVCLLILTVAMFMSAVAPTLEILFVTRVIGGVAAGGIIPVSLAMVGDRFPLAERQVALSRVILAAMLGQLIGSVFTGLISAYFGWRYAMAAVGVAALGAFITTIFALKPRQNAERRRLTVAGFKSGYADVFANPRAKFCYGAVFVEGVCIMGILPYVATLMEARGAGGIKEAGFVVAGIGVGGVIYSALIRVLMKRMGNMFNLMRAGGFVAALGYGIFALQGSWPLQLVAFTVIGIGFFMIHNPLQTQATELAPKARGSAVALHAFFFFLGHAAGPAFYAITLGTLGVAPAVALSAVMMAALGVFTAFNLQKLAAAPAKT